MPNVSIREIDNTGSETQEYVENIVLVPALDIDGYSLSGSYNNLSELIAKLTAYRATEEGKTAVDTFLKKEDLGFGIAVTLLNAGFPIEYSGELDETTITAGIDAKTIGTKVVSYPTGFNKFIDRAKYDIRFIIPGTFTDSNSLQTCIEVAAARGDAYALLGTPSTITDAVAVEEWIQSTFQGLTTITASSAVSGLGLRSRNGYTWTDNKNGTELLLNYAALFAPTVQMDLPTITVDSDDDLEISVIEDAQVPAYVQYLLAYIESVVNNPTWFAIAGSKRGTTNATITPIADFGDVDIDIFQPRSGEDNKNHIATNAIYYLRGTGYTIWGNRTMHPLNKPANGSSSVVQLVASDFLNIRSLSTDLKKTIYRSCRNHTFDPNSDTLWFTFKSEVTPILEKMKANQGIKSYQIIRETTAKKAIMACRIKAIPIEGVEDFDVTVEFTDSIEE